MSDPYHTAERMQLLARGYNIIPNIGKVPAIPGWNEQRFVTHELERAGALKRVVRWEQRFPAATSTGVRLDNGLVAADYDTDHEAFSARFWPAAEALVPALATAPARYGGGEFKVALFLRLDGEPFGRVASRRYPGLGCFELFGGLPGKLGRCARQFGILGPHSFNPDGSVAREYVWGGVSLADVGVGELPGISRQQASQLVDLYDAIAVELGFKPAEEPAAAGAAAVYDITAETRFHTNRGGEGISYAELCDAHAAYGDHRCASSFIAGRTGENRERCWVFRSPRHDCVAVYLYGEGSGDSDGQTHYPVEHEHARLPEGFAAELGATMAVQGTAVPKGAPNWRERYVESGKPKASLHNTRAAIENEGVVCSEDTFHNKILIGRHGSAAPSEPLPLYAGEVTDGGIGALRMKLSDQYGLDFTEKHVRDTVNIIARENRFDPVAQMLAEAEANWDGVSRLDRMAVDYFNTTDTELARACVRKTMIAAVARVRTPGVKFDTIPVLEAKEGWNKSSAWQVLAGEGNFSDESIIGKASREVQEQLGNIWIHESADLAGMRKAEVETVKAFASRVSDRARPAYGHYLIDQPRHSIEVGTTNSDRYLQAQTGNRRFWPLVVLHTIDLAKLRRDRLQLWGEAAHRQSKGESLVLPEALWEAAAIEQEARRVVHPWEAIIAGMEAAPAPGAPMAARGDHGMSVIHTIDGEDRVSTKAIFEVVLQLPNWRMHRGDSVALGEVMRVLGWTSKKTRIRGEVVNGYVRPAKVVS